MELLLEEAEKRGREGNEELARRYVKRAKNISMRLNLKTLGEHRDEFCRKCFAPFVRSSDFRVRLRHGRKILTCLRCGAVFRRNYGRKRQRADRRTGRNVKER